MQKQSANYYNKNAVALSDQYNALDPADVHAAWFADHLPKKPGFACDIGAGSGRDANWLASNGWDVIAVEPSKEMAELAQANSHPAVTWLDDSLPGLEKLRALGHHFDLILVSAVWMHLPPGSGVRERAFRVIAELLNPSGVLVISLRRGDSDAENKERCFYQVPAQELEKFAEKRAVALAGKYVTRDLKRKHVTWETLVFSLPDDGTGSLPLLRHIIVNDDKASSYKLGLLRVLTRIAESAPGIVVQRTDDYVDIPLGIVGLYWLKQYKPLLLTHGIPQHPNPNQGYGFAGDDFRKLEGVSTYDLRIGARFDADRSPVITGAIRDACRNITQMPVKYISYPGQNKPIFDFQWKSVFKRSSPITLSKEYLLGFGTFRIPLNLWETFGHYACWLEPAILREWSRLTQGWGIADYKAADMSVFDWEEGRRDTTVAARRFVELRDQGERIPCTWTASRVRTPHMDHCFPWARWLNNDLWNLLPVAPAVNTRKGDKLPSASTMSDARERILNWWQHAYLNPHLQERFLLEAGVSLPMLKDSQPDLEEIYMAMLHQRARLKSDQQLVEWASR